ncbi:family 78 glycoside hydrolase catalytic domain [Bifidobacterium avesanii]|uniref:family 78 glycoside hydrolase catalytic domain n=1 Tax=Bifidobacterium avesanii TaxID=1798157 RepID=UPI00126668E0|nr:family 78 glycoside hydrolase catalytic domain [Bifidobacterium avesanii]KAB8291476.1 alpha-L-rhamnosidase [Bifidobacterium avesanii]
MGDSESLHAQAITHIRINERIEPVDLEPGAPVRVRWWPESDARPGRTAWRVVVYDRPVEEGTEGTENTEGNAENVLGNAGERMADAVDDIARDNAENAAAYASAAQTSAATPIWRSETTGEPSLELSGFAAAPSARYWLVVESTEDGARPTFHPASAPVTFGTAPAADDWQATPIWADPATAASPSGPIASAATAASPSAATASTDDGTPAPVFSHLAQESSDAGDAFFQRPTIKQTEHNGLGWAFLRGVFDLPDEPVRWATLHMTAASVKPGRQFVYRAWLNGTFVGLGPTFPIGDEARTDGFDVTDLIVRGGRNAIGVVAWTLEDQRFLAQLDLGLADGRTLHFGTDGEHWTGIVGNGAYPDSLSTGTQYCESPAEDLVASRYPFALSDPDWIPTATPDGATSSAATPDATVAAGAADWPAAVAKPPFAKLAPTPTDKVQVGYEPVDSVTLTDDNRVIIDFGRAWMGGVRLAPDAERGVAFRIRYGEVLNPDGGVKYQLSAFNTYEETWRIPAGSPAVESWGLKVFRYVEIIGADDDASQAAVRWIAAHPESVDAAAIEYPFDESAAGFEADNRTLNTVWRFCRNTIEAFNGPIYADSWTRERAAYEADAWLQWRSHLLLDDAPSLGAYSVDYLIANRTWPTEWPLYLILAVHDGWMATGDPTQARREYDRLVGLLPERYLDAESGLIVKDPGDSSVMDGDLVDWPPVERDGFAFGRVNTVVNALASQAYADMAELARALGRDDDADRFARTAGRMRAAIHERLFDDFQGAYVDGLDTGADGKPLDHASEHASAFALAFAEVPADRVTRIGHFLEAKGMACSVYTAAVLLEGLYRAGFGRLANRLVASHDRPRSWWNMILAGAGGTSEGWDVSIKGNTTYSHPWAASPAFLLPQGMLGIRPLEPGYRTFAVRPQLEPNHEAEARVPTPYGPIAVHARRGAGKDDPTALTLTVPAFATAEVTLDASAAPVTVEGPARVTL